MIFCKKQLSQGGCKLKKNKGFSFVEVLIVISLLSVFSLVVSYYNRDIVDIQQKSDSESRIVDIAKKIEAHYIQNAWGVESEPSDKYFVSGTDYIENNSYTDNSNVAWVKLAKIVGIGKNSFLDGYNRPYKILISSRMDYQYGGVLVPYRTISLVSNGGGDVVGNEQVIKSTLDANGTIKLAAGETASVFNSLDISLKKFEESKSKIETIASLYTQYYWGKVNKGAGDASINYFAGGNGSPMPDVFWDVSSSIKPTCAGLPSMTIDAKSSGVPISKTNLDTVLGLSKNMITTSWGVEMGTLNCNNQTFKTGGTNVTYWCFSKSKLPFIALLGFSLPNLESYVVSVYSTN